MTRSIIYSGEYVSNPLVWEAHELRENGSKWLHLIPKTTLHWRSGEYGIDPLDVDTLMDIILHEGYVPTQQQEQANPSLKAKSLPWLLETDNTADALKYHIQRIRSAAVQFKIRGNKALDPIRQGHQPDHDLISEVKQSVDLHRWAVKYGELPIPPRKLGQIRAQSFELTGMKEKALNSAPDSMMIVGSTTITTRGSNG